MDYPGALAYLSSLVDREKNERKKYKTSLVNFKEQLEKFSNPQKKLKGFLIGGTKGKGSTAYVVEAICRKAQFKTGLFTSPHLISYKERIKIDGEPIPKAKFASLIGEIAEKKADLSVFETLTTMAFLLFLRERVDYSVFEVGLGGRLDATNVFEPDVSIMTSISYDHTEILGETLEEIAGEKSKILRGGKINISAPQEKEIEEILKKEVENIEFLRDWEVISLTEKGTVFKLNGEKFTTGLIGKVQALNSSLAITACRKIGVNLSNNELNETLQGLKIPGRFQIVSEKPRIILDGAHNVASVRALKETIRKIYNKKVVIVFSCLRGKDIGGMLKELNPIVKKIYPTEIPYPRKMPIGEIKRIVSKSGMNKAETTGIINKDIESAVKEASSSDIIIVTGSFYLVGEALKQFKN